MDNFAERGTFDAPVRVVLNAKRLEVATTRQAADLLLYRWPIRETAHRIQARMACMRVLGGSEPPETARKAFTEAAAEAEILAGDEAN